MATLIDFDMDKVDQVIKDEDSDSAFCLFLMEDGRLVASNEFCPPEGNKCFVGLIQLDKDEEAI